MKTILLNISIGCLFLCSCQQGKEQSIQKYTVINIDKALDKPTDIFLSDIATDIEYIKLEFTQNSMIKEPESVYITNDFVFLLSFGVPYLMQFDRKGKFIRQVGNIGKGPGEYILCRRFTINENDKLVLVYTNYQDKILFYNFEGEFQFSLDITDAIGRVNSLNTDEIICRSSASNRLYGIHHEPFKLLVVNYKGDTSFYEPSSFYRDFECRYCGRSDIFYTLNDSLYFYEYFNDTIYLFNNNQLSPAYTLLWDKYKDIQFFHPKTPRVLEYFPKIFIIEKIQATNQNIYIYCYHYHTTDYFGKFDKKTGELKFSKTKYLEGCIKNDYDGGLSFTPGMELCDNKWVASFRADSLMTTLTPEFLHNSPAKYPDKKEALKRFVSSLNENDNPVLMVVTLK